MIENNLRGKIGHPRQYWRVHLVTYGSENGKGKCQARSDGIFRMMALLNCTYLPAAALTIIRYARFVM
jgi:hypothetical protein